MKNCQGAQRKAIKSQDDDPTHAHNTIGHAHGCGTYARAKKNGKEVIKVFLSYLIVRAGIPRIWQAL